MTLDDPLRSAVARARSLLEGNDREFLDRVWSGDPAVYHHRVSAVGFQRLPRVLDAGCGMGQWTVALARLNEFVDAVDYSGVRVDVTRDLTAAAGCANVRASRQSIEDLQFPDGSFDGVFCYGVLMLTDYRRTIAEIFRVLKPGGRAYVSNTGVGWYVRNIIDPKNPSPHYDPRQMAIDTINESIRYFATGTRTAGKQVTVPSDIMSASLRSLGFVDIRIGGDGTLRVGDSGARITPFYDATYNGLENVYEVLCERTS